MRPVIFLDIDGVVVTPESLRAGGSKHADVRCLAELERLVDSADADIVISSSWRTVHPLEFIREVLERGGFRKSERIIDQTRHLHYRTEHGRVSGRAERCDEIRAWLNEHPRERFVILDDDWGAVAAIEDLPESAIRDCVERIPDRYMEATTRDDTVNGLIGRKAFLSVHVLQFVEGRLKR